jgi:hypothetical protein
VVEETDYEVPAYREVQKHSEEEADILRGEDVSACIDFFVLLVPSDRAAATFIIGVDGALGELGERQYGQKDHE